MTVAKGGSGPRNGAVLRLYRKCRRYVGCVTTPMVRQTNRHRVDRGRIEGDGGCVSEGQG